MSDYYVADRATLVVGQRDTQAAGINRYALVNQEARQTLSRVSAAAGVK
jgi:hypothetical protein